MSRIATTLALVVLLIAAAPRAAGAAPQTFPSGSLIIPMDQAYQDRGMLQAYGLLFQLLRQGVPVQWVIDPAKTWHAAPCNTAGDPCAWDCAIEGSGVKCPYPTASPDFFAATVVRWDSAGGAPGAVISNHGYRGGPFVIDAAHRDAAMAIIDAWNTQAAWPANPWAQRSVFNVVSVHETTAPFTGNVSRPLVAAPTIAVFSDGNEDIATGYLRAAGIKQSNGAEFPAGRCGGAGTCGPGTANPDMLTVPSVAGNMGTCGSPNNDHKNGALFTADGLPAYCQIMSMHWNVADRETVECGGGACPATQAQCPAATPITYHGHEVVAEVRAFLAYPVHFFAECQAVNAYENTTPNPAWPFLDDDGRDGHFLTTEGMPPACPCTEAGFTCVTGGCNGMDCCLPQDAKERGAGFLIADRPSAYRVFSPEIPYNQFDGHYAPIGGSEPAYNLSSYLGTMYKNDRQVTFLSGPNGPGVEDIWMTGYLDGTCDITEPPIPLQPPAGDALAGPPATACSGKVSYLGGHAFSTSVPMSGNTNTQGARLFLNALFEADCVTTVGQPGLSLHLDGPLNVGAATLPVDVAYGVRFDNAGAGAALAAELQERVGAGVQIVEATGATIAGDTATWQVGSISGVPARAGDPPPSGSRPSTLRFAAYGDYTVTLDLSYRVGASARAVTPVTFTIHVGADRDGDGVPDDTDPFPDDPRRCGDSDDDTCDDCTNGPVNPRNDGPDADADGVCDAGEEGGPGAGGDAGGGCCQAGGDAGGPIVLGLLALAGLRRRRRPSAAR
ncbi:MAG TPA: MYXO-CTERM sorting domain-containing protein [Kofleriaceae bacterium]|jgi:uncharacterized protein (TIGR03382 family)|nr:MYXO-CTERM sorting domain-containing protein [Kofleriaceae bacterium]